MIVHPNDRDLFVRLVLSFRVLSLFVCQSFNNRSWLTLQKCHILSRLICPPPTYPFSTMLDILPATTALPQFSSFLEEQQQQKINHGNLYLCQQHTVIELVEVSPPPARRISSVINSSSAASSSYTSSSSSSFDDEEMSDEEEEEESVCSSYCSSDFPMEELDAPQSPATVSSSSDSFNTRMKRILSWREHSESPSGSSLFFHKFTQTLIFFYRLIVIKA